MARTSKSASALLPYPLRLDGAVGPTRRFARLLRRVVVPGLLLSVCLGLAFDFALTVTVPVWDWDTNEILADPYTHDRPPESVSNIAHPLGLTGVYYALRWLAAAGLSVRDIWTATLVGSLAATVALIVFGARRRGASWERGLILAAAYVLSPAVFDLSGRAEENLLFHPLFLLALFSTQRVVAGERCVRTVLMAAASSMALALDHLQPFLILVSGYGASLAWRVARERIQHRALLGEVLIALVIFAPCLAALSALKMIGLFNYADYPSTYYSIVSQTSLPDYVTVVLNSLQKFLFTYRGNIAYNDGINISAYHLELVALGLILFALIALWTILQRNFMRWPFLASLALAALYEPISSERWDTVVLSALTMAAVVPIATWARRLSVVLLVVQLLCLPIAFGTALQGMMSERAKVSEISQLIGNADVVYATQGGTREMIAKLPRGLRVAPVSEAPSNEEILVAFEGDADPERLSVERRAATIQFAGRESLFRMTLR